MGKPQDVTEISVIYLSVVLHLKNLEPAATVTVIGQFYFDIEDYVLPSEI